MLNASITDAANLSAEVVLRLGKLHSAQDLRKLQAKLTGTAREVRELTAGTSLLSRLGKQLTDDQTQLLRDAAKLIASVGRSVEHAKEKLHRAEVKAKALQKERNRLAQELVVASYQLPTETLDQKLNVIKLKLAHGRAGCFHPFSTPTELSIRLRNFVAHPPKRHLGAPHKHYWSNKVESFCIELREEVRMYLTENSERTVQQRMESLQASVQSHLPDIVNDPYEIETLRLWSVALCSVVQGAAGQ